MMIRFSTGFALLFLLCRMCCGESSKDVPDEAEREITRRGSLVERVGTDGPNEAQQLIADALKPPPDDSHKWFISLVTMRDCQACERLKRDFAESSHLKPFVDTKDRTQSWAHYNIYASEDDTQKWRFEAIKFGGFPTLLVQPPRNERFGSPKTVVLQKTGYNGDAKQLADEIRSAITAYVRAISKERSLLLNGPEPPADPEKAIGQTPLGVDLPFTIPPKIQPLPNLPPLQPFDIPPAPAPTPSPSPKPTPTLLDAGGILLSVLGSLLSSGGLSNVLLLVLAGLASLRTFRNDAKQPVLLDDRSPPKGVG